MTYLNNITTDPSGNLILFGSFTSSSMKIGSFTLLNTYTDGSAQFYLAKVSPAGSVLWAVCDGNIIKKEVSITAALILSVGSVATDTAGNIYIASSFSKKSITIGSITLTNADPSGTYNDIFVAKYSPSGALVWASSAGGTYDDYGLAITVKRTGEVYVAGAYSSPFTVGSSTLLHPSGTGKMAYIAKFSATGAPLWGEGVSAASGSFISSLATDDAGDVYATGGYRDYSLSFGPVTIVPPYTSGGVASFLVQYSPADVATWGKTSGTPTRETWNSAVAVAPCGQVWTVGEFQEDIVIGHDTLIFTPTNDPIYVAGYDFSGNILHVSSLPAGGDDQVGIACDPFNNVFVSSDYSQTIIVGPDTLALAPTIGVEAFYIAKQNPHTDTTGVRFDTTLCDNGEGITLTGNKNYATFYWNDGLVSLSRKVTASGKYTLYCITCDSVEVDTFNVNFNPYVTPSITLAGSAAYSIGGTVTITATLSGTCSNYTIHWMNKGVEFATSVTPYITYTKTAGVDSITAMIVPNCPGCYNSATSSFYKVAPSAITNLKPIQFTIYPNPAKTSLTLSANDVIEQVTITDIVGQEVRNNKYNSQQVKINIADLVPGVYFVKLNGFTVKTFIKE
jgi:hypothetical protein